VAAADTVPEAGSWVAAIKGPHVSANTDRAGRPFRKLVTGGTGGGKHPRRGRLQLEVTLVAEGSNLERRHGGVREALYDRVLFSCSVGSRVAPSRI